MEVHGFVQAPLALVASSALLVVSIAAQGLVNVRRDSQLCGPASLYVLTVANSGERKSTCDALFGRALRQWESERRDEFAPQIAQREAERRAFEAKRAGLEDAIKHSAREGQATDKHEQELCELMKQAPASLLVPRLLFLDTTPEALAYTLATGWPSGGVLSAEAGAVFGAHGIGPDSILRNLALLNTFWDGIDFTVDRRTKESFQLRGRRLSFGLMVQEAALRDFLERAGTLPRGTRFLARFLVAWPNSTQGTRNYRSPPDATPALNPLSEQIQTLLNKPLSMDDQGCLTPREIDLSSGAQPAWIEFHDDVESDLVATGALRDVRDVGAKAADNAARMAALFHVLEPGHDNSISEEHMRAAARIVAWHLTEARRLLSELDAPRPLAAAIRLDNWLQSEARSLGSNRIPIRRAYQYGPACVRQSKALKEAVGELQERGRARFESEGKCRYIEINPALAEAEQ